jgi:hypothetical protein
MKRTILALLAGVAVVSAGSFASAQQDNNNPAPSYSPSATGQAPQTSTKINDGNNSAPNYNPSATGQTPQTSAKINDGNNSAPNYNAMASTTSAPKVKHASTAKSSKVQHATHHHKNHTPST